MKKIILFKKTDRVNTFPQVKLDIDTPYEVEEFFMGDTKHYKILHKGIKVIVSTFQIQNYIYSKKEIREWKNKHE